jgi:hypothetical protein
MMRYLADSDKFRNLKNQLDLEIELNGIEDFAKYISENGIDVYGFIYVTDKSHVKNIAKETTPLVKVYLATAEANVEVTAATKEAALTGEYTGILFEEVEQQWVLGKMPQSFIPFEVQMVTIEIDGAEYVWGKVEKQDSENLVQNGKKIADLEYFCAGFRGDEYRGMGYPNNIETTYLVDPSKKYDTLDIHYAYVGSNESVQKSEKDITIVCEDDGSHTAMKALITKINSISGLNIANPA